MKVWITKYALTQGIFEIEAERCTNVSDDMIEQKNIQWQTYYYGEGNEWHLTKEGAIKRAKEMREKKIKSLKKQLNKIEKLDFN